MRWIVTRGMHCWPFWRTWEVERTAEAVEGLDADVDSDGCLAAMWVGVEPAHHSLHPVEPAPALEPIEADDLGVVCWMAVLPHTSL